MKQTNKKKHPGLYEKDKLNIYYFRYYDQLLSTLKTTYNAFFLYFAMGNEDYKGNESKI